MECILNNIRLYKNYYIHINIDGFTISAGERYIKFINNIFAKLFSLNYNEYLSNIYIYNSPSVINYITPIFRNIINNNNMKDKVIILS